MITSIADRARALLAIDYVCIFYANLYYFEMKQYCPSFSFVTYTFFSSAMMFYLNLTSFLHCLHHSKSFSVISHYVNLMGSEIGALANSPN